MDWETKEMTEIKKRDLLQYIGCPHEIAWSKHLTEEAIDCLLAHYKAKREREKAEI